METSAAFTEEQIRAALCALENEEKYGDILRAKGYVKGASDWIYFDYVPGQADVRSGAPAVTGRICVIGAKIDPDALSELFGI